MESLNLKSKFSVLALLCMAVGWGVYLYFSFYPGAMSTDSFYIMEQARSGLFKDDHPPLLAMTWWVLARISLGQEVILSMNLILFWCGSFLVFAALSLRRPWLGIFGFIIFAIQPAILGILGVVWIDIFMAGLLMMAVGSLAFATVSTKPVKIFFCFLSLLFAFFAAGARHNSAAAAVPLITVALLLLLSSSRIRVLHFTIASFVALVVALLSLVAWGQVSRHVTPRPNNMTSLLAMYDLAGIASRTGHDIPELSSLNPVTYNDVIELYTPRSVIPLQVGQQIHAANPAPTRGVTISMRDSLSAEGRRDLMKNWASAIRNHPIAYLAHRADVFTSLIGLPPWTELWSPVYSAVLDNELGIKPRLESAESQLQHYLRITSQLTYFFCPAIYLLISAVAFPLALVTAVRKNDNIVLLSSSLFLSGIAHMTGLFFTAASSDFRYSHWMIVSTCLGAVILLVRSLPQRLMGRRAKAGGLAMRFCKRSCLDNTHHPDVPPQVGPFEAGIFQL